MKSSSSSLVFQLNHVESLRTCELSDVFNGYELSKLKQAIKSKLSIEAGDIQLSWQRNSSPVFVSIIDDSDLKRCIDYQVNQQKVASPLEQIVCIRVAEIQGRGSLRRGLPDSSTYYLDIPGRDREYTNNGFLSKSTQLQCPIRSSCSSAGKQPCEDDYDRSKYSEFNCYNCAAYDNGFPDATCAVCLGVGKLLKSKEIDAIEYLVEKKLCMLFPELKSVYKRFQQQPSQKNLQTQQQPVTIISEKQASPDLLKVAVPLTQQDFSAKETSQIEDKFQKINDDQAVSISSGIQMDIPVIPGNADSIGTRQKKSKKRKNQFDMMFSPSEEQQQTELATEVNVTPTPK